MAGTPTKSEVHTMLQNAAEALYQTWNFGNGTLLPDLAAIENNAEGEYPPIQSVAAAAAMRAGVAAACSPGTIRSLYLPLIREYARLYGSPWWNKNNVAELVEDCRRYWIDESDDIEERDHTYDGTISADGSNTGDGKVLRLTVDDAGYKLNSWGETKTLECIRDHNTGARRHEELFIVRGEDRGIDLLDIQGSGTSLVIPSRHAGTSRTNGSLLRNASFQTHDGTSSADQFRSWTFTSGEANGGQDTTTKYRGIPGDESNHCLKLSGDAVLSQAISVSNLGLNRRAPYYLGIAYNRETGSGDGTLRIRMGGQTTTVVLAAQAGWNLLEIALDANSFFENFNEDDLDITVELASHSTGYVLLDDFIFAPLNLVDGAYWLIRGGPTPFLAATAALPYGDKFEAVDTAGTPGNSKIAFFAWLGGVARAFPTTSGTPSVTEP